jgi:signal transduction histidine kinase
MVAKSSTDDGSYKELKSKDSHLRRQSKRIRQLTHVLSEVELKERERISQLLHDDLQQLLVAAKFAVESLRSSAQQAENSDLARGAQKAAYLLSQAIESARALSKGLSPSALEDDGLQEALAWLADDFQKRHGLSVDIHSSPSIRIANRPLRNFLYQAALEILFNVVKHSGTQEAVLELRVQGNDLLMSVSDQGKGFEWSRISSKPAFEKGYGLLNIQERCSLLGGGMEVCSELGQGTRVSISFPVAQVQVEEGSYRVKPLVRSPGQPVRVVVVDDHEILREGFVSVLSIEPDIEVVGGASDGKTALKIVSELEPDVVMMDVFMRGIDGIETTRQIRKDFKDVKIVGLTAALDSHIEEQMRKAGAEAVLSKSATVKEILDTIRATVAPESQPGEIPRGE